MESLRQALRGCAEQRIEEIAAGLIQYALLVLSQGRTSEAEALLDRVAAILPNHAGLRHFQGLIRQMEGDLPGAEALIRRSLSIDPEQPEVWSNLGAVFMGQQDMDQASDCFRRALRRKPDHLKARNNLGVCLLGRSKWAEAIEVLEPVVAQAPTLTGAAVNLAMALVGAGRHDEAVAICANLIERDGDNLDALLCLADAQARVGDRDEAISTLRRALAHWPVRQVANNLANLLLAEGRNAEAVGLYRAILEGDPDDAQVLSNLGGALTALGLVEEAEAAYRRSLSLRPDPATHSGLLFTLQNREGRTSRDQLAESLDWGRAWGHEAARCIYLNARDPERRLRVGYLSPDFRHHAMRCLVPPLLDAHDRGQVEVICYHDHPGYDEVTATIRALSEGWRDVFGLSDVALVEQIQADGIDILVECAGHSGGNRLRALARKPAPIQVSWLVGYGGTTGLDAIDYVLADDILIPYGFDAEFSERVLRLPVAAPFRPDPALPEVTPLPDGPPLLACLGNPARIGRSLVEAWQRMLDRLPDSRLLLMHGAYGESGQEEAWRRHFAPLGERLILSGVPGGWGANMHAYGQIALALDTFPAAGATSTLIPLWMGIPTASLAGECAVGRFGGSILRGAGLHELVAHSLDEHVEQVVSLASDRKRLAGLRRELRPRLAQGPLCDALGFAREIERHFRAIWRQWCETTKGESGI
ncbi:hypothetical protein A6A04_12110 [Paramagnetospirillum marisnigri]|uniref:protein O-GlcNAc transferase n=1 Tax=Paramagnetospirillum marisnigri TaxID=1285242 RepID=A0A178MY29_9PROT|nr:hypothetical protein A6A04_12110 [Paramagnetospirillum marisnigri]